MVYVPLAILCTRCANLTSSFANDFFQTFLDWLSFVRFIYSVTATVAVYVMEFATICSWPGEALGSNMHCPSVTPWPKNRCASSDCVIFF